MARVHNLLRSPQNKNGQITYDTVMYKMSLEEFIQAEEQFDIFQMYEDEFEKIAEAEAKTKNN